jgi:hypothetical protein
MFPFQPQVTYDLTKMFLRENFYHINFVESELEYRGCVPLDGSTLPPFEGFVPSIHVFELGAPETTEASEQGFRAPQGRRSKCLVVDMDRNKQTICTLYHPFYNRQERSLVPQLGWEVAHLVDLAWRLKSRPFHDQTHWLKEHAWSMLGDIVDAEEEEVLNGEPQEYNNPHPSVLLYRSAIEQDVLHNV